ncbi:MAG: beta-ketoacyl-[acyl-carrier-protein] synthase family protein [Chthoniobacteraceae bacterium]
MSADSTRRVVITGLGVIAPNGSDLPDFWGSVVAGKSSAGPLTRFDAKDSPVHIACEVRRFDAASFMDAKVARRLDRSIHFAVAAAMNAVKDAGVKLDEIDPSRVGSVEGTSVSHLAAASKAEIAYQERGYKGISMFQMLNGYTGGGAGEVAAALGIKGHAVTLSSGSASGNDVMGYASMMIRDDEADVMIVGGAEAPIQPLVWGAFCQSRVMTRATGDPAAAMKPFDVARSGFVLGEGAGFVVMEELGHAVSRGARIYAEVLGHGRACEAFHPVAPEPNGMGVVAAIKSALRRARIDVSDVDYINCHGTATEINDLAESRGIRTVVGQHARRLACSSTKPITGHLMAAAGAVETIITALAIYHQVIPPTANLQTPDPECGLDFVPGTARPYPIRTALNLSSGFGGKNSCLALRRWRPREQ